MKEEYRYTDHLRLEIEDNGIGIEDELREQVFAMFYSSNNPDGAGMGLALVSKIVEFHHGTVSVHSEPGKGTVVTVTFPMGNLNIH
ncbi:MAG: HAMP domain-containing histidine kinase [Pedobacter sp.]|nr:MAG: HAMP domain-containing histidine kinase [Pedobacter sp.]